MARAAKLTEGSMVAVMGGDEDARIALTSLDNVWIANINGTGQIVLSGTREGLDDLLAHHSDSGWRRATPRGRRSVSLTPDGAGPKRTRRGPRRTSWGTTEATLISNVDGQVHTSPESGAISCVAS